jgi:hypothetical protein
MTHQAPRVPRALFSPLWIEAKASKSSTKIFEISIGE